MPTGDNPKSRENLKKGVPFNAETASKAGRKGAVSPKRLNSISLRQKANEALAKIVGQNKEGVDVTLADAMIAVLADEAVKKKNMKAWELLRDTSGQKPADKVIMAEVDPSVIEEVEGIINESK